MVPYLALVRRVVSKLNGLSVAQMPRGEKAQVDQLARQASSSELDLPGIRVEYLSEPNVSNRDDMEVDSIDIKPSWMDPIMGYLTMGSLSTERIKYKSVKYH